MCKKKTTRKNNTKFVLNLEHFLGVKPSGNRLAEGWARSVKKEIIYRLLKFYSISNRW